MADVFTKAKRSEVLSRIRSRGNKDTELALARVLRANGISGWRRQVRVAVDSKRLSVKGRKRDEIRGADAALWRPLPYRGRKIPAALPPGTSQRDVPTFRVRPDFVFRQVQLALFVDGCFWHGCPKHATKPPNNRAFWQKKLTGNKTRDQRVTKTLQRAGWRVLRVWEHELARRNEARLVRRIQRVLGYD